MKLNEAIREFVEYKKSKGKKGYKTGVRYEIILRIFCLCMRDPDLEKISLADIMWYLKEMERLGWKDTGRNLVAIALRVFFEHCNLRGYKALNMQLIPIPERDYDIPRVTDLATFTQLISKLDRKSNRPYHIRDLAILLLLWDTGARSGEIMCLDAEDIDVKNRTAIIKTEKSRGRRPIRQIFWTEETNKALIRWMEKREHLQKIFTFANPEALFVSISKSQRAPIRGRRMTQRNVNEVFRVLSNRAGLEWIVNPHSLRHSMGRDSIKALRDPASVSNILGHSNIESSMIYQMIWGDRLKEDWQKVMKQRLNPLWKKVHK